MFFFYMCENIVVDVGIDNLLYVFIGIEFNIVFWCSGFEFFFLLL